MSRSYNDEEHQLRCDHSQGLCRIDIGRQCDGYTAAEIEVGFSRPGNEPTPFGICQLQDWGEQSCNDALAWHESNGIADKKLLLAFKAGHHQGWNACLSALRLHGLLKEVL